MRRVLLCLCLWALAPVAPAETVLALGYLRQQVARPPVLSNLDPVPGDEGIAGARLGLAENRTTGRFLNQRYEMAETEVPPGGDLLGAARKALAATPVLVLDAPAADVLKIADLPEAREALIFDVASADDALRGADCRANVLHTLPSRAMRADALMEYLTVRRWTRLALITGPRPADQAWAAALKGAAHKFGLKIVGEKAWRVQADLRRSAGAEVPLFTQGFRDHDVLLVADETDDFARYIPGQYLVAAPGRGLGRAGARGLVAGDGAMGRAPVAGPVRHGGRPADAPARLCGLGRRPDAGRGPDPQRRDRCRGVARLYPVARFRPRRLQGPAAQLPRLERSAAPADRHRHPARACRHGPLRCLPAPARRSGHARPGPARNRLPRLHGDPMKRLLPLLLACCVAAPARGAEIWVTNEKDDTISVIDIATMAVVRTVATGERPRGITFSRDYKRLFICASDSNTVQVMDPETGTVLHNLPSGEDPEQFALSPDNKHLYISNENDAITTVVETDSRHVVAQIPVGIEPEGAAVSPDGKVAITTSESTNMAHWIDTATETVFANTLVDSRPRYAEFTRDGSALWVSAEIGGTVTVFDTATQAEKAKIRFRIPGVHDDLIQPVGIKLTPDGTTAFVALGPSNHVAVIDTASYRVTGYILTGRRVWHMAFSPDARLLFTTNGVSGDVTVIDVATRKAVKTIKVGRYPWGAAMRP